MQGYCHAKQDDQVGSVCSTVLLRAIHAWMRSEALKVNLEPAQMTVIPGPEVSFRNPDPKGLYLIDKVSYDAPFASWKLIW